MPPSLRHYLLLLSALLALAMLSVHRRLFRERSQIIDARCSRQRIASGMFFLITVLSAAWDVGRLHKLDTVPMAVRDSSLILFASATMLQIWAMVVNPFFAPEIRIQADHKLVIAGPYRLMRHPGYVAMFLAVPASALSIGSWLALLPAMLFCIAILKRAQNEDEFLQDNLAGYRGYCQMVPKILPNVCTLRLSSSHTRGAKRVDANG